MMMMAQQMKQMPSLPTLASALCHIATIAVVMHGRTDLRTAPGVAGGSHRHLESAEPPHDPLAMDPLAQTVARLEKAVDAHGARLTAVEEENAELTVILNEHMEGHAGTGHGSRGGSRRMQTDGGNLHPQAAQPHADPVYIIKPNVTRITTAVRWLTDMHTVHCCQARFALRAAALCSDVIAGWRPYATNVMMPNE